MAKTKLQYQNYKKKYIFLCALYLKESYYLFYMGKQFFT